jgi:predicted O-methyltransferase YrrM
MTLRHHRTLRSIARRLPLIGAYERRIAELTSELAEAQACGTADGRLFVPPGHFYSPYPDLAWLSAHEDAVFNRHPLDVPAVDLRVDAQWRLFDELVPFLTDVDLPRDEAQARRAGRRFWSDNPAYGDGDALFLTAMLRHLRPARLIELGCGYSSACTLDARERYLGGLTQLTFVDPYPELLDSLVHDADRSSVEIHESGTQDVDLDVFDALYDNDVLFIDSTHVSRTGSDVNRIFFDILPALRPGVVIHLHDVFTRFEYPAPWVYEWRGWNEQYVLRAFLQYNDAFEIVLWPGLLQALDRDRFMAPFADLRNSGGAFWFRKTR